jgi:hypothetical protein
VLEREVVRLRKEKAAAREECRRLRQQGAQNSAEIEHLTQRLLQLAGSGSKQPSGQASPVKQAGVSARAQQQQGSTGGSPATLEQQPNQPARGGIGSPIEEPAAAGGQQPAASSPPHPGSSPRSKQSQASSPSAAVAAAAAAAATAVSSPGIRRSASGPAASPGSPATSPSAAGMRSGSPAASPSAADMRHFRREMQHTLHTAERPGVVSRFPHSLGSFLELRPDLEASPMCHAALPDMQGRQACCAAACKLLARRLARGACRRVVGMLYARSSSA